jgi:transcriptional regulator with XRE-family HTH domain
MRYASFMTEKHRGKHYLREWREYRGLSLRRLSDRLEIAPGEEGWSHTQIGRIETNVNAYSQDFLEAVSAALDVSVTDLLSVDPKKEGEVIDLMRRLQEKGIDKLLETRDLDVVYGVIAALPKKA